MNVLILFGPPGVGKGTQADFLAQKLGYKHISAGEVLREAIASKSPLGEKIAHIVHSGNLISDELISSIMQEMLSKLSGVSGILLDGFPRTVKQAELLDAMKTKIHASDIQILNLDAPNDELLKRLIKRGKERGRIDDNLATIKNRLVVYHKQTFPVIDYYSKHLSKYKIHNVDGHGTIQEITKRIFKSLKI